MEKPVALVVDDEVQMVSIIAFALDTQGIRCLTANSTGKAWSILQDNHVDLVVLDIMMPHGSGLELTKRIRSRSPEIPIILLTALSDEKHRIDGLEAGADDYVTKPFSPRELALRAQAVIRRSTGGTAHQRIEVGPLAIDRAALTASWHGRSLPLSQTEVRLMAVLAAREGEIVTHRELLNEAWSTTETSGGREMIKTTVYRLRRNLDKLGIDSSIIHAHRGEGYSLILR